MSAHPNSSENNGQGQVPLIMKNGKVRDTIDKYVEVLLSMYRPHGLICPSRTATMQTAKYLRSFPPLERTNLNANAQDFYPNAENSAAVLSATASLNPIEGQERFLYLNGMLYNRCMLKSEFPEQSSYESSFSEIDKNGDDNDSEESDYEISWTNNGVRLKLIDAKNTVNFTGFKNATVTYKKSSSGITNSGTELKCSYTRFMDLQLTNAENEGLESQQYQTIADVPNEMNNKLDESLTELVENIVVPLEKLHSEPKNTAETKKKELNLSDEDALASAPTGRTNKQRRQGRARSRGVTQVFGLYTPLNQTESNVDSSSKAAQAVRSLFSESNRSNYGVSEQYGFDRYGGRGGQHTMVPRRLDYYPYNTEWK